MIHVHFMFGRLCDRFGQRIIGDTYEEVHCLEHKHKRYFGPTTLRKSWCLLTALHFLCCNEQNQSKITRFYKHKFYVSALDSWEPNVGEGDLPLLVVHLVVWECLPLWQSAILTALLDTCCCQRWLIYPELVEWE